MASEIIKFPRLPSRDGQVDYDTVLVLARTDLFFAVAGRGHVQDTEVILYHFPSLLRAGEKGIPSREKGFSEHFTGESFTSLCFLISLLFLALI